MKRFFTLLLAVSLMCACGEVEMPQDDNGGDKIENENTNQGDENEGNENEGNENEGNEGNENEGGETVTQSEIVLLPTSEGWPTSYPTTQTPYTIEGQEFYLLNAAIYNTSNGIQFKKQTGYIANKSAFGTLVRIELIKGGAHSGKMLLHIGDSEMPAETEIKSTETSNGYTFDCTAHNAKYFKLTNDGGGVVYLSQIRIVYLTSGSNTPGGGNNNGNACAANYGCCDRC